MERASKFDFDFSRGALSLRSFSPAVTEPNDDTTPTLTPQQLFAWCREHADDPELLAIFITVHEELRKPEFADDVVATAKRWSSRCLRKRTRAPPRMRT